MNVTGPALLTANDLALAYGHQRLLEAVTLLVGPGEKVGKLISLRPQVPDPVGGRKGSDMKKNPASSMLHSSS